MIFAIPAELDRWYVYHLYFRHTITYMALAFAVQDVNCVLCLPASKVREPREPSDLGH